MIQDIKTLLGESAANFTEDQIALCSKLALAEVEAYCRRSLDYELEMVADRIALIKLYRLHTEGLTAQSLSGVSESYVDGYPADIMAILNRKRKIRVI